MSEAQTPIATGITLESQLTQAQRNASTNSRKKQEKGQKKQGGGGGHKQGSGQQSARLRGHEKDSPAVRLSKTVSWLLRHGAKSERLPMRTDGSVKVKDLVRSQFLSQ